MSQELTIIDQVKEVAAKSGVPLEIDVTRLATLAERGRAITSVTDPNFYSVKKEMQKTRTELTSLFMDARRGFNKLAEGVRDVEKAVLGEFTPEEDRLIALDKAEKERVLKEERLAALPAKRERITTAGIEFTDEEILTMTDADFEIEYNVRLGAKLEADRISAEEKRKAEEASLAAERAELQRQKEEAERIERAREEERERAAKELQMAQEKAIREAKEAAERLEREKKEAEERRKAEEKERILRLEREEQERKERIEREAREKQEAEERAKREAEEAEAKRLADEKYQSFLKNNNYDDGTDIIVDGTKLYRLVAEYNPS
jgi:chromosome segregation ATPase